MTTTNSSLSGRTLVVTRDFAHPVERVWRCLTEPEHLAPWFPGAVELDLSLGGRIRFHGEGPEMFGTISELDPPWVIAYDWGGDLLRWTLSATELGCRLVLEHIVADLPGAASFAAGWTGCLDALDDHLAGRPQMCFDRPSWARRHETFMRQFRLGAALVEPDGDGWRVRYDRQLTAGPEAVAALLAGTPLAQASLPDGAGGARLRITAAEADQPTARALAATWEQAGDQVAASCLRIAENA